MKKLYLLLLLSYFCSCQESPEEAMLRLVNEWNGKEVKFPSRSVFTIQGKDTVDFKFAGADYKVVTYIDSMGCTCFSIFILSFGIIPNDKMRILHPII